MKMVSLPIYEDGIELNEHLDVSVELFQKIARTSIAFQDHVKIVPGPEVGRQLVGSGEIKSAAEEIELLDRIVHGFPPQPKQLFENQIAHDEKPGRSDDPRGWRTIKGFSGYIMNANGMIIDKQTQKTVATEVKFDRRRAMLCDDDNSMKWMNVEWLMFKTFPELTN